MKLSLKKICLILAPCIICASCSSSTRKEAESFNDDGIKKDQLGDFAGAVIDFNKAIEL
jgi:hypothetical protein